MESNASVFGRLRARLGEQAVIWFACLCSVLVLFGTMWEPQLSIDTYPTVQDLAQEVNWMLTQNGRPVIAFLYWLWLKTGIPFVGAYHISFAMAAVLLASSVYLVQDVILRAAGSCTRLTRLAGICIGILTVLNVFCIEYFMFIEVGGFSVGIFCAVLAFWLFSRWLSGQNGAWILALCALSLVISVLSYQATTGLFVVLSLPLICRYGRSVRSFLTDNIAAAVLYGLAMAAAVLLMTLVFSSGRIDSVLGGFFTNLIRNLTQDLPNELRTTSRIMPSGRFLGYIRWIAAAALVTAVCRKNTLLRLAGFVYVAAGTAFTAVFPTTYLLPRTMYPAGALAGLLLAYVMLNLCDGSGQELRIPVKAENILRVLCTVLLAAATAGYLWAQHASFQKMIVDRYKTNAEDSLLVSEIGTEIERYEESTGITVTKLVFYEDQHITVNYPGLFRGGAMGSRAFAESWSQIPVMEYYLDRDFEKGEMLDACAQQFSDCDWEIFDVQQLIFDADTLHICVY